MARKAGREPTTEGQRLLRIRTAHLTCRDIARPLGARVATVTSWLAGDTVPDAPTQRLLQEHHGIEPAAWARSPGELRAKPQAVQASPGGEVGTSLEEARHYLLRVQAMRVAAEDEGNPDEIRKCLEVERRAIEQLARIRGDLSPADETRLTATPRWAMIRGTIVDALRPYPDARAAVVSALREIDAAGKDTPWTPSNTGTE